MPDVNIVLVLACMAGWRPCVPSDTCDVAGRINLCDWLDCLGCMVWLEFSGTVNLTVPGLEIGVTPLCGAGAMVGGRDTTSKQKRINI